MVRLGLVGAAVLLLAGCEVSVKGDPDGNGNGSVSVNAPGIGLNVDLPAMITTEISGGGDLMFPGATMSGVNVVASSTDAVGNGPAVELAPKAGGGTQGRIRLQGSG